METILNLHRKSTNNIGDLNCAPHIYFPKLLGEQSREILGFREADEPTPEKRREFNEAFKSANIIVIGGGGLLGIDFFEPFFRYLARNKAANQKVILWGAGHNSWTVSDWRQLKAQYSFDSSLFDLIGLRDVDHEHPWVPCSSCMSPALAVQYPIEREIGVYAHVGTMKNEAFRKKLPAGFDLLDNSSSFEEAIRFLGSSELILTDSYHGAYWATLLGRKVVAFPSSSKFYDFKHAIPLCVPEDWKRYSRLARVYDEALEECRQANLHFAVRVSELVNH